MIIVQEGERHNIFVFHAAFFVYNISMKDEEPDMSDTKHFVRHEDAKPEIMNNGITKRILSYDESLMVEELIFEEGAKSKMHSHAPVQIPYVKSGVFEFTVAPGGEGEVAFVLKEGDTAYMAPDEPHCVRCIEAGTLIVAFSPVREDYI